MRSAIEILFEGFQWIQVRFWKLNSEFFKLLFLGGRRPSPENANQETIKENLEGGGVPCGSGEAVLLKYLIRWQESIF